jgi:thiol-disulfide isomerase/thioredoxin
MNQPLNSTVQNSSGDQILDFKKIVTEALNYADYRAHVNNLVIEGKTTGDNQEERLIEFTKLNVHRMNRLDKTLSVDDNLAEQFSNLRNKYVFLLIGDAWCGDCAQILPVLEKIAHVAEGKIEMSIISRDTFPELIEAYKTNGAKSVPKLLILDAELKTVVGTWGPRPKPGQAIMLNWKANIDTISWEDFEKDLHLWYTKDKGNAIFNEISELLKELES